MASNVTIHHENIRAHLQAAPFGGSAFGERKGFGHGDAQILARRMAVQARVNAATMFNQRTGDLVSSVVPIVIGGRGAAVAVGVGTTAKHGAVLEVGSEAHIIRPQGSGYLLRSNGPRSKGGNPTPLDRPQKLVQAPALAGRHWMENAVRSVIPGARVHVQVHKDLHGSDGR